MLSLAGLIVTPILIVMGVSGAEMQSGVITVGLIAIASVVGLASFLAFSDFWQFNRTTLACCSFSEIMSER